MAHLVKEERKSIAATFNIGVTVAYPDTEKKRPAVILIMGTGKTNRDGNERGFHTDFYKKLSDTFVEQGYVCVRYDKRGTYETKGSYKKAGLYDLIDDSISVLQFTKSLPYVDEQRVIICGHSEGAMIATLLSQKEKTAGLILLGGAGICMKDALLYQNRRAAAEFQKKKGLLGWLLHKQTTEEKTNAKVDVMFKKCMESGKDALFFGGATLNAKWIREHSSYTSKDFTDLLKQYPNPVLAITGTEDLSTDYMALCHRLNSAASLYNAHLSKNDKNEVDNLNKNRNWTVLFIGGASGTGKSSLAYEIARFYGVNVLEVDDIHLSVETVTTKEEFPAIHYWKTDIDWKNIGVNGNVNWLIDVSKEIAPVLKELANRHIEDKLPIIIEGDFISPEFTASFNNPEIKSIFMKESDKNQILRNYLSREGGDLQNYRADISVAYGDCLSDTCGKSGIKMIDSRPWSTALSRAIESLL